MYVVFHDYPYLQQIRMCVTSEPELAKCQRMKVRDMTIQTVLSRFKLRCFFVSITRWCFLFSITRWWNSIPGGSQRPAVEASNDLPSILPTLFSQKVGLERISNSRTDLKGNWLTFLLPGRCMEMVASQRADVTMLEAGDVYRAGKGYGLVPIMSEVRKITFSCP